MMQVPVVVKRSSLPGYPRWVAATVPCKRTVLVRPGVALTARLLAHELAHVLQAERHPWPLAYLMQWVASGFNYHAMPFEVEARKMEREPFMLSWARDLLEEGVG
jgi:hypothetical protein